MFLWVALVLIQIIAVAELLYSFLCVLGSEVRPDMARQDVGILSQVPFYSLPGFLYSL